VEIMLNGEPVEIPADAQTVAGLLKHLDIDLRLVAVEINRDVVPKARYPEHALAANDAVEIVSFVGGG